MSYTNEGRGVLPVIQSIASKHESGELEIQSSRNHGVLRFSKGKLVDATFGTLSGFQAINAAVALLDLQFNFKPLTSTPRPGSIAPNERRVLKSFFGIEAADASDDVVQSATDWNTTPHQVVPLADVEEVAQSDKPVVEEPLAETAFVSEETSAINGAQSQTPFVATGPIVETPTAREAAKPRLKTDARVHDRRNSTARVSYKSERHAQFLRRAPVALIAMLLVALAAAAAITFRHKLKSPRDLASAAGAQSSTTPQTIPSDIKQQPVSNTPRDMNQAGRKPEPVAPQQTARITGGDPTAAVAVREREQSTQSDVQDLTGQWHIINTVDKTAYQSFQNMQIGFRLKIQQKGNDFTAIGEKVSENGRALPTRSRTPIHVTGSIDGDNVVATFVEDGSMRKTNGRFSWRLQNENASLTGTFVTAAANSSGKSAATRE
jgi:hypothetical protein